MGPIRTLRTQLDTTAEELREGAAEVSASVNRAADSIALIGVVAVLALVISAVALAKATGVKPPW